MKQSDTGAETELKAPQEAYHPTARCCWCGGRFRRWSVHWVCETQACMKRQQAHAVVVWRGRVSSTVYVPLPVQVNFHEAGAKYVLFGGAAAGTKSHALRWDAYKRCLAVPGFRALLLRKTLTELRDTHIDRMMTDASLFGATYMKSEYRLVFENGSVLQVGHCEDDDAYLRYLSTEYDAIYPDELVTFSERAMLMVFSRARTTKIGVTPMIRAGTNPGGAGAYWIKRRWLDKDVTRAESAGYTAADWVYVKATLDDNPYVDADYEAKLDDLPEALRRAYRFGDWDIFPGQYFTEWRRDRHVVARVVPPEVPRLRVVDWGYVKPGYCGWIALLPDGRAYLEEEYVFAQTVTAEVAQEITRRTKARGVTRIRGTIGDTQMWAAEGSTGETMAETFARFGVSMQPAHKDRVNGWQRLRHWLRDAPDGQPWFQVSPDCPYAIRTLPALVMDSQRPEDVDSDGEDHAADALRYGVMARPSPGVERREVRPKAGTVGALKAWLRPSTVLGSEAVRR